MRTAGTGDVADGGRLPWALIAVTRTEDEPSQVEGESETLTIPTDDTACHRDR